MRVVPVRYTGDVAAARRFTEALGLTAGGLADAGTWVALSAPGGGGVGLHAAHAGEGGRTAGETELSYEADEPLEEVAARLRAAGFDPAIVDESFGRSLRVVDPDGAAVQVNAVMTDLHGYRDLSARD